MKTGMTRLGRRSPSRTLAVPAVPYLRLAARGGQPVAPARARGAAPDIIELILADHDRIRRLLHGGDDAARYGEDPGCPGARSRGNAGAALAGVHACRAGAGSARVVRGSAAERRDRHRRPAGPSGCAGVRWTAACSPTCWSSPMPRPKHCPSPARPVPSRTGCPISRPHAGSKFTRPLSGSASSSECPGQSCRSGCGPMPAAITAPWQMWPRLSEHRG